MQFSHFDDITKYLYCPLCKQQEDLLKHATKLENAEVCEFSERNKRTRPEELDSSQFEVNRFGMSAKLLVVILFLCASSSLSSPTHKSNYIEQENSCREVCGLCDCNGFYCEDECICECSLEEDESKSK